MQLKVKQMGNVYNKLGMNVSNSHHKLAFFEHEGRTILKTRLSHGSGDAKAPDKIRGDFKLNEDDFRDLVNCPLSKEAYIEILKIKGFI